MLDPDALGGTFTHWLIYRMPPGITSLADVPPGAAEGVNDFGRRGYGGPCPPRGAAHHYHFVVLALDARLGLAAGARRSDLDSRLRGHVLGRGELVATYQRGRPVGACRGAAVPGPPCGRPRWVPGLAGHCRADG